MVSLNLLRGNPLRGWGSAELEFVVLFGWPREFYQVMYQILLCWVGSIGENKELVWYAIRTIKDEEHDVFVDFAFLNIF